MEVVSSAETLQMRTTPPPPPSIFGLKSGKVAAGVPGRSGDAQVAAGAPGGGTSWDVVKAAGGVQKV